MGYLTFDFILSALILQDFTSLGLQTIFHHVTAASGFFLAMIMNVPGPYLMLAVGNQHTEISAPFMHIRQLLYIHTKIPFHSMVDSINGILFAVFFLFGRFIFQLRLAFHFFICIKEIWESGQYHKDYTQLERFTFGFSIFAQVSMIFLNFYWL